MEKKLGLKEGSVFTGSLPAYMHTCLYIHLSGCVCTRLIHWSHIIVSPPYRHDSNGWLFSCTMVRVVPAWVAPCGPPRVAAQSHSSDRSWPPAVPEYPHLPQVTLHSHRVRCHLSPHTHAEVKHIHTSHIHNTSSTVYCSVLQHIKISILTEPIVM